MCKKNRIKKTKSFLLVIASASTACRLINIYFIILINTFHIKVQIDAIGVDNFEFNFVELKKNTTLKDTREVITLYPHKKI